MAIPQRIRDYLDSQNVPVETLHHDRALGAQEVAHSLHISGKKCVKAVVVGGGKKPVLAVVAASHRLDFQKLKAALKWERLEILPEGELVKLFPDCDLGAVPALGNLYGLEVWVDRVMASSEKIIFCAGSHEECIRMNYSDFAKLAQPTLASSSEEQEAKAA